MSYAEAACSVSINTIDTPSARPTLAEHMGPVTIIVLTNGSIQVGRRGEGVVGSARKQAGMGGVGRRGEWRERDRVTKH